MSVLPIYRPRNYSLGGPTFLWDALTNRPFYGRGSASTPICGFLFPADRAWIWIWIWIWLSLWIRWAKLSGNFNGCNIIFVSRHWWLLLFRGILNMKDITPALRTFAKIYADSEAHDKPRMNVWTKILISKMGCTMTLLTIWNRSFQSYSIIQVLPARSLARSTGTRLESGPYIHLRIREIAWATLPSGYIQRTSEFSLKSGKVIQNEYTVLIAIIIILCRRNFISEWLWRSKSNDFGSSNHFHFFTG